MEEAIVEKMERVEKLALKDQKYQRMMKENKELEILFDEVINKLPSAQRAIAWDFVMQCEDMSRYVLRLACEHMEFTE